MEIVIMEVQINGYPVRVVYDEYDNMITVDCSQCNHAGCWFDIEVPETIIVNDTEYTMYDVEYIGGDSDEGVSFWTYSPADPINDEFSIVQVWND
jgi:hypothetical protein